MLKRVCDECGAEIKGRPDTLLFQVALVEPKHRGYIISSDRLHIEGEFCCRECLHEFWAKIKL